MTQLLSIKDVAKHLGISVSAVKIRCTRGKIVPPTERRAGELFWTPESLGITQLARGCTSTVVVHDTPAYSESMGDNL